LECKHPYYQLADGKLLCVVCGKPPPQKPTIEDKIGERPEVKLNVPAETRRIDKPVQGKKRR
jgi:uncharacterized Zn finger protein (UPF0148 family)